MNGRINGQLVVHEDLNVISFINFDERAGLLAIDKVHVASNTVWALSVEHLGQNQVSDLPGAFCPRWIVKLYVLVAALDRETFRRIHVARLDK